MRDSSLPEGLNEVKEKVKAITAQTLSSQENVMYASICLNPTVFCPATLRETMPLPGQISI